MKHYTVEEIESMVREIWKSANYYDAEMTREKVHPAEFAVVVGEYKVDITVSCMYEAPGLSFAQLKELSDFFESVHINDDARFSYGGCETCDYGSEYGFTLTVRP